MEEVVRQFCTFSENWSDSNCGTALRLISLSRILLTRALRLAPKRPWTVSTSTFKCRRVVES